MLKITLSLCKTTDLETLKLQWRTLSWSWPLSFYSERKKCTFLQMEQNGLKRYFLCLILLFILMKICLFHKKSKNWRTFPTKDIFWCGAFADILPARKITSYNGKYFCSCLEVPFWYFMWQNLIFFVTLCLSEIRWFSWIFL